MELYTVTKNSAKFTLFTGLGLFLSTNECLSLKNFQSLSETNVFEQFWNYTFGFPYQ